MATTAVSLTPNTQFLRQENLLTEFILALLSLYGRMHKTAADKYVCLFASRRGTES